MKPVLLEVAPPPTILVCGFTIVGDPDCPKDEIQVRDERGRVLHRQKITATPEEPDAR